MKLKPNGTFYATLSGLFFGLLGYFGISLIEANISVPNMLFWRFMVSSIFIAILLLLQKRKPVADPPVEILKVILYGIAFYGSTAIFYFIAAQYIGSGLAMVVFFTYPALVMLVNFLLYKQNINKIYYFALLIIFIGMICLVSGSQFNFNFKGLAIALLSALLYALYIIASKNSPVSPLRATFWISIGSALTCLITALVQHSFIIPPSLNIWLNICGIGIICTALPIVLLLQGLKYLSSLQASILSVLEPVFVVIFGILLLGEKITLAQAAGILILLSGALLSLQSHRYERKSKKTLNS